jgi:hypothetical protein
MKTYYNPRHPDESFDTGTIRFQFANGVYSTADKAEQVILDNQSHITTDKPVKAEAIDTVKALKAENEALKAELAELEKLTTKKAGKNAK